MKTCHIDINTWEACAEDRVTWSLLVKKGTKGSEKERKEAATVKRANGKETTAPPTHTESIIICLQPLHQRLPFKDRSVQPLT